MPVGQLRRRRGSARAHGRLHLHHGRGALGHRRRDRRRREAVGAVGDAQVPLHRDGPRRSRTTRWTCTAARASCSGPTNYLGRGYQVVPVAITVEGANILTRSLIIFGQGAIRCHPFVLQGDERRARPGQARRACDEFDAALFGHIGFTISNAVRSFVMALTLARFTHVPDVGRRPSATTSTSMRFCASFAFAADVAMLTLGGYLKKKENLSARLGDVLSAHVPRLDGAQALREPGPARGRPAARRMGLPHAALQGAGAAARLPAQLPEPLPRRR